MQLFPCKEILSAIAIALTFIAFVPYIRAIIRGTIIPHVFLQLGRPGRITRTNQHQGECLKFGGSMGMTKRYK
jgi:hypothetical protein